MKIRKFTLFLILVLCLVVTLQLVTENNLADASFNSTKSSIVSADPPLIVPPSMASGNLPEKKYVTSDINNPPSVLSGVPKLPIPNDPYIEKQWALDRMQVSEAWQITGRDSEVLVAVLDTGIDRNHEDLINKVVLEVNFTDSPTPGDIHGHGTHIAGIIAAQGDNGLGVVGISQGSYLMNVKVADDKGRCQASTVAEGIVWAVDNGAKVINISIELKDSSPELQEAVDYAWNQGAVIIAAAGNDCSELPVYPAYYENCIAVAATNQDDKLAPLSNHGDWVDVAAPGFNIYSTVPDDSYDYKSGTSSATAYVSGLAALLFDLVIDSDGDGKLNDEVRLAIEAGCEEIAINGVGTGQINIAHSLAGIS